MKIKLKKFNIFHGARFILMSLNPKIAKQLSNNFFYYLYYGIKGLFIESNAQKYAIFVNGKFAGSVAIYKGDWEWELGYFILPQFRGCGVASKVVKEMCQIGFNKLGFSEILARTTEDNVGSIKVLEKNGFVKKGNKKVGKSLVFVKKK